MTQETINLLIGGGIAIVASSLGAALGYWFQTRNETRKRKWELEDRRYNEARDILKQRVKQAEEYVTQYFQMAIDIYNLENDLLTISRHTVSEIEKESDSFISKIRSQTNKLLQLSSWVYAIGESKLENSAFQLSDLVQSEFRYFEGFTAKWRTRELDKDAEGARLQKFKNNARDYYLIFAQTQAHLTR